jgi:hypothetical protein
MFEVYIVPNGVAIGRLPANRSPPGFCMADDAIAGASQIFAFGDGGIVGGLRHAGAGEKREYCKGE